ncbi:TAXI family TRAP transporter solute-binding subunit [Streptomyces capparidis]
MSLGDGRGRGRSRAGALARSGPVRWALLGLAVAGLLAWWLVPSGGSPYPRGEVSFSTGVDTGVYARYGELLEGDIEAELPGVRVRLVESQGSVENVARVAAGRTTFTVAAADAVADYTGPGRDGLRACARLYDDYLHLVVPATSSVRSARDLAGLRVGIGPPSSGVRLMTERVLRAAGLDPERDIEARSDGIDTAPERLKDGALDAFFWSGGLPTAKLAGLTRELEVRLVPLGGLMEPLREQAARSGSSGISHYRQATIPGDAYPDLVPRGEAVSTISVPNLLVTTERADAALMERITRTVIANRDEIGEKVHAAQLVDLRTAIYTDPLPLHAGAERYYRSVKP